MIRSYATGFTITADAIVDLQTHTHLSDGKWSPEALVDYFLQGAFATAAITDHDRVDTMAGIQRIAQDRGFPLLVAAEMTTRWHDSTVDILTFGFENNLSPLEELCDRIYQKQSAISRQVYDHLVKHGHIPHDDERVAGVVSISTFSSLREVTEDYVKCFLPFIAPMLSSEQYDEAIAEAGKVAGFNPAEANTERAASTLRVPLLLIHGEDDWKIPIKHAERIKAAVGNSCLLVRVPERGHGDLLRGEVGVKLLEQSLRWLEEAFVKGNIDR